MLRSLAFLKPSRPLNLTKCVLCNDLQQNHIFNQQTNTIGHTFDDRHTPTQPPVRILIRLEKGHQDTIQPIINLPLFARLNIATDSSATKYRQRSRLTSSERVPHKGRYLLEWTGRNPSLSKPAIIGLCWPSVVWSVLGFTDTRFCIHPPTLVEARQTILIYWSKAYCDGVWQSLITSFFGHKGDTWFKPGVSLYLFSTHLAWSCWVGYMIMASQPVYGVNPIIYIYLYKIKTMLLHEETVPRTVLLL
jgi:hypothetical protein